MPDDAETETRSEHRARLGLKDPGDEPYRDFTDRLVNINCRAEAAYREEC